MGTHGTLEWLPGTNLGATKGDWTFELTLNPTIYPYIVSNPGEAMVARDRISIINNYSHDSSYGNIWFIW